LQIRAVVSQTRGLQAEESKNLEIAWEQVRANRGSGGVDGQSLETFGEQMDQELGRLHTELKQNTYRPQPPVQDGAYRRTQRAMVE
jgi:hypothetical protein